MAFVGAYRVRETKCQISNAIYNLDGTRPEALAMNWSEYTLEIPRSLEDLHESQNNTWNDDNNYHSIVITPDRNSKRAL